jgi:hypothetical protein
MRKGFEKGGCLLYSEDEAAVATYTIKIFGNEEAEGTSFEYKMALIKRELIRK